MYCTDFLPLPGTQLVLKAELPTVLAKLTASNRMELFLLIVGPKRTISSKTTLYFFLALSLEECIYVYFILPLLSYMFFLLVDFDLEICCSCLLPCLLQGDLLPPWMALYCPVVHFTELVTFLTKCRAIHLFMNIPTLATRPMYSLLNSID